MATTTNYNWSTPDDTSLVKDGAAAIRTLGSSIDTTTKALNPSTTLGDIEYRSSTANTNTRLPIGTNGQVLAVVGGVPAWSTTADQTPLTTKGDIFTFTTVDARLGVGTNGQVLTADSAEATGLKWATPSSGASFVGVSLCGSAAYNMPGGTEYLVTWDTENYDTNGFHSTSTDTGRVTIPSGKAGKYLVTAMLNWASNSGAGYRQMYLKKNGTTYANGGQNVQPQANGGTTNVMSQVVDLAVGDYLTITGYMTKGGGDLNVYLANNESFFNVTYLGA